VSTAVLWLRLNAGEMLPLSSMYERVPPCCDWLSPVVEDNRSFGIVLLRGRGRATWLTIREMGEYIRAKYVEGRWLSPEHRRMYGLDSK
jgi:hypothetical protein